MSLRQLLPLIAFGGLALAVTAYSATPRWYHYGQWTQKQRCERRASLVCHFRSTRGNSVTGRALFTAKWNHGRCLVRVRCAIAGLNPKTPHGWHIHAYGDVSLPDGTATGGHFNSPLFDSRPHGLPSQRQRQWGDLGNLRVNYRGMATYDSIDRVISLRGIVGRGMIVHALRDRGNEVQPTGGSGARLAQCVIGYANPARL